MEDNLSNECILTEECRIQTGLDEDAIRAAQPIEHVLDEVIVIRLQLLGNRINLLLTKP